MFKQRPHEKVKRINIYIRCRYVVQYLKTICLLPTCQIYQNSGNFYLSRILSNSLREMSLTQTYIHFFVIIVSIVIIVYQEKLLS